MIELRAALDKATRALGSFLWLGNNLHNADTDMFREMYRAALDDARTAYEAGAALAAQSDGLDVERLARALRVWRKIYVDPANPDGWYEASAAAIARAYAVDAEPLGHGTPHAD